MHPAPVSLICGIRYPSKDLVIVNGDESTLVRRDFLEGNAELRQRLHVIFFVLFPLLFAHLHHKFRANLRLFRLGRNGNYELVLCFLNSGKFRLKRET